MRQYFFEPINIDTWPMLDIITGPNQTERFIATSQMHIGDTIFFYVGGHNYTGEKGIYAVGNIISNPYILHGAPDDYCNNKKTVDVKILTINSDKPIIDLDECEYYFNQFRSPHMMDEVKGYKLYKRIFKRNKSAINYWFVNQGTSYREERQGNFLYAPKDNFKHHSNVKEIKQGDIILCNKNGYILSVAKALTNGYESPIPDSIKGLWDASGYKVDVEYVDLKNKLRFNQFKDGYMDNIIPELNPFDRNGNAKMGYLYPVEQDIAQYLIEAIDDNKVLSFINGDKESVFVEMQELQEEEEQFDNISSGIIHGYTAEELLIKDSEEYEYMPRVATDKEKVLREKTDPKLKATRMELANHNCEINHEHKTFTNSSGEHQYLECHHIIPLNAQKDFPNIKLDSMFNIIALCPNCHMQVHHASKEEKGEIFSKMYELRKEEMIRHGFDLVKINEIFNKYYLKK